MLLTSSTEKMSKSSESVGFALYFQKVSASFSSFSFLSFHSFCLSRQPCTAFDQHFHVSWNQVPGCKSSTHSASLIRWVQARRCAAAGSLDCQRNRSSSKPSASVGIEKVAKDLAVTASARSGVDSLRCQSFISSSVRTAAEASASPDWPRFILSASSLDCLSAKSRCCTRFLVSASGSPSRTAATLWNPRPRKAAKASLRSAATRFAFNSMTT
mmetsp:Transcript_11332/g.35379  ORF Transcript_11332/g.35379 Transcript_11332/m.35379 type:complete len:214 (-) Transcript_11332:960-1601(-)